MAGVINVILVIVGIIMIILVLLQPGKSAGLSGAISGGAEQLFGKQKARGVEYVLHRGTIVAAVIFFALAFVSAYIL
jgi:preprotein translocase subunit SecG